MSLHVCVLMPCIHQVEHADGTSQTLMHRNHWDYKIMSVRAKGGEAKREEASRAVTRISIRDRVMATPPREHVFF